LVSAAGTADSRLSCAQPPSPTATTMSIAARRVVHQLAGDVAIMAWTTVVTTPRTFAQTKPLI
jgi:hypothetical protein